MTRIDVEDDALERAVVPARIERHFERAREWGALEDAEREHRAEKEATLIALRR